jgi:hypothetical protein
LAAISGDPAPRLARAAVSGPVFRRTRPHRAATFAPVEAEAFMEPLIVTVTD